MDTNKHESQDRSRVMLRFIHHLKVERPPEAETAAEARERLREKFPRAALRRMTHLGMLLGSTLEGASLSADDALVYASVFAETRALEDYLGSFPAASPVLFQTSIHPGGIQQVLIGRQQPIARLWPLAGRARLVEQALLTALMEPAARVGLAGGEERGTWLLEHNRASGRAFAFGAVLTNEAAGAMGSIRFDRALNGATLADDPCPSLPAWVDTLAEKETLTWRGGGGVWSLVWR